MSAPNMDIRYFSAHSWQNGFEKLIYSPSSAPFDVTMSLAPFGAYVRTVTLWPQTVGIVWIW